MHRPSNVDNENRLLEIFDILHSIQNEITIIFPIHPRSLKNIRKFRKVNLALRKCKNIILTEPLGYFDFLSLFSKSKFVLTDSGSIQQETSYLNIPCLTLRDNTERPVTVSSGSNELVGANKKRILYYWNLIKNNKYKTAQKIKLWDGKTSERIVRILLN